MLPTPTDIIAHLDRFVRGQTRAKQDLAVAVYNHYLAQAWRDRDGEDLGRYHLLMIGPTGVGKTHLVRTLANYLGVPVGFASAAGMAEAGYKGNSVETVIASLLSSAGGDVARAEKGIVFLDEVDKIRRADVGGSRDVSGEGVQNALLTLLDGRVSEGMDGHGHQSIDTSRLLFVCTGAFVGLQDIVEQRLGSGAAAKQRIGFQARADEVVGDLPDRPIYEALCQAETRDLVEFGMIPEFIGRFATLTVLHELSQADLRAIISSRTEKSALERQQKLAHLHGIELEINDEALDAIAAEAARLGTGARGLHRLIGQSVDGVDHRWPELAAEGVVKVVVTRACVEDGAEPELVTEKAREGETEATGTASLVEALRGEALSVLPPRPREGKGPQVGGDKAGKVSAPSSDDGEGAGDEKYDTDDGGFPTDVSGWSAERLREEIERIKVEVLEWAKTTGSARKWWETFEEENEHRPSLIFRLVEELEWREATISEFFLAYIYSNTDNIQANLHYLDYVRLKKGSET